MPGIPSSKRWCAGTRDGWPPVSSPIAASWASRRPPGSPRSRGPRERWRSSSRRSGCPRAPTCSDPCPSPRDQGRRGSGSATWYGSRGPRASPSRTRWPRCRAFAAPRRHPITSACSLIRSTSSDPGAPHEVDETGRTCRAGHRAAGRRALTVPLPSARGRGAAAYDRAVSVTPIRLFGDPVLRTPAAPVVDFDADLRRLVGDLTETMFAAGGAGLAAPQIGVGLRVFTWFVDGEVGHLVNPDVTPVGEETEEGPEGCLSIPGYRWDCRRHLHVVASGWDMHGDPVRVEGSELLARAIQHETDHLDGVLFVDRLDAEARAAATAALAEAEWAGMAEYLPVVKVSPH